MPDELTTEDTEGLAQFNRLLPEARALDKAEVKAFRTDPVIALQNVTDGVRAVIEVGESRLASELPMLDLAHLRDLVNLAIATSFAVRRAENITASGSLPMLKEATVLRARLLAGAEALAAAGLLPAARVSKIRKGRGAIDWAADCVELAALFKENAEAIRGKSPISAADVKRAGELGAELLNVIKPKGSTRDKKSKEQREAIEDRDRLGTLLAQRYAPVRRAGAWFFGDEVGDHVPLLGSVKHPKKRKVT